MEELKEKLIQDMDSGDRGKHLIHFIQIMESEKVTNYREITRWLLNMCEESRHKKFTQGEMRCLWQVIIAGQQQEGNSSLLVFIFNNLV